MKSLGIVDFFLL